MTLRPGRRRFIQAGAALPALGVLASSPSANVHAANGQAGSSPPGSTQTVKQARFAYVSTVDSALSGVGDHRRAATDTRPGIHVFAITRGSWRRVQVVESEQPMFLALHPSGRVLYAVNRIELHQGLCTGSVEAYAIDPLNGCLSLLDRQPLSLSGTLPSHAAISPDGRSLVVALSGGGAYNVMSIGADGRLGTVSGILKETGCGPDRTRQSAAHPQMVLFNSTGEHVLSADLGCDRLSVLNLADGQLTASGRIATLPGSGPRALAIHPAGRWLYVLNELSATVACYDYDARLGVIGQKLNTISVAPADGDGLNLGTPTALALHPSGHFLYAAYRRAAQEDSLVGTILVFRIDSGSGKLVPVQSWNEDVSAPLGLVFAPNGGSLHVINHQTDNILRLNIDAASGMLNLPHRIASAPSPACLVIVA
ncbi:lactonase family protein [Paraburkholderia haematera]|uniref:6-phosphogluconolactonase n=1 Tax=Paraburkholderia haematera TaxID=2793077 RepID=A0ABM8SDV2_9BURK|nr:beta-propeller fold lactonase family protein [Paraburkholderia haematera]CAE6803568.1 6-phosphogluconolactonase [Paraburkholderia haematera]